MKAKPRVSALRGRKPDDLAARGWLRPNFVAVCLDETKNRARWGGNPGNVGSTDRSSRRTPSARRVAILVN
jgi:hypothetical protein